MIAGPIFALIRHIIEARNMDSIERWPRSGGHVEHPRQHPPDQSNPLGRPIPNALLLQDEVVFDSMSTLSFVPYIL